MENEEDREKGESNSCGRWRRSFRVQAVVGMTPFSKSLNPKAEEFVIMVFHGRKMFRVFMYDFKEP